MLPELAHIMNKLRVLFSLVVSFLRVVLIFSTTLTTVTFLFISYPFKNFFNIHIFFIRMWGYFCIKFFGFKVVVKNVEKDVLGFYVAPHSSFWDIIILSYFIDGFFISKAEVKKWPLVGLGAKLINTVFIEREKGSSALLALSKGSKKVLEEDKYSIIVFPEGTRTPKHMSPFKDGVFYASKNLNYPIIPVIIYYKPEAMFYSFKKKNFVKEILGQAWALERPQVYVEYLEPVYPSKFETIEEYKKFVHDLMSNRFKQVIKLSEAIF